MTKEEALKVLVKMRAWRRWGKGDQNEKERPEMPEQKEVDEAFDVCIKLLQSSIPSNLYEAVTTQMEEDGDVDHFVRKGIDDVALKYAKLGAEWMAWQGIVGDAEVCKLTNRAWVTILDEKSFQNVLYDKFNAGDKVVVQIRKK